LNGVIPATTPRGWKSDHADVRSDVTAVFALQNLRCRAGELDVLDPALEFTGRVLQGLAVLFADQLGDSRFVLLQQLLETKHHLRTLGRRCTAPGRESRLGGVNGLLDGRAISQWHLMNRLASGRVEHIGRASAVAQQFAIDQMRDEAHGDSRIYPQAPVTGRLLLKAI